MDDRLAALQGEIADFRRLAAADPDVIYPDLAFALADLSTVWRDLDRPSEAVDAAREAADLLRLLADRDDDYRQPLAAACTNLSARLQDAGRTAAAMEASRVAVDVAAGLPNGGESATILAAARLNLATQLFRLGAEQEGAAVLAEVGRSLRRLIEAGGREAASTQVRVLQDLAERAHGNRAWAEHVALRRALALGLPGDPPAGRAVLAYALDEAAAATAAADAETAVRWAEQATAEFGRLAAEDGDRYGAALRQAADRWLGLTNGGDDPGAWERAARAVAALAVPASEERAVALTMLTLALAEQARLDEALAASDEALTVWRTPPVDCGRLASALNIRAGLLSRAGRADEALATAEEAVGLWRSAEGIGPAAEAAIFADTLRLLVGLLVRGGRYEEALAVADEGTRLVLSTIIHAGIGSSSVLDEFERLRGECLAGMGRSA